MNIKMVKMGMDIDETRNHRIRGIVPTKDGKYLFVEILQGNRPNRRYTSLSPKEYSLKYPNEKYVYMDACFRVDIPIEYWKNYSPEYTKYNGKSMYELAYTHENIVKVLQMLNKNIDNVELVNTYYIDKFCEEKGFFKLYDDRLKHSYEPIEVLWSPLLKDRECKIKFLYTCYSANGDKYQEEFVNEKNIQELIKEYGKDTMSNLLTKYIDKEYEIFKNEERRNECIKAKDKIFEDYITNEINNEIENDIEI